VSRGSGCIARCPPTAAGDSHYAADVGYGVSPVVVELVEQLLLLGREFRGAAPVAASCPSGDQPCLGAFPDDVAFELGKRPEDLEDQPPARRRRVDRLLETSEPNAPLLQLADSINKVLQRAAEPIEPPNDKGVAGAGVVERRLQPGALRLGARGFVVEGARTASGIKGIPLQIEVLVSGTDSGVADEVPGVGR